MDARRVDADSSGARDGVARLSVRPLRGVELRLSEDHVSATRTAGGVTEFGFRLYENPADSIKTIGERIVPEFH